MRNGVLTIVEFSVFDAEAKTAFCTFPIVVYNSDYKDSIISVVSKVITSYANWEVSYV